MWAEWTRRIASPFAALALESGPIAEPPAPPFFPPGPGSGEEVKMTIAILPPFFFLPLVLQNSEAANAVNSLPLVTTMMRENRSPITSACFPSFFPRDLISLSMAAKWVGALLFFFFFLSPLGSGIIRFSDRTDILRYKLRRSTVCMARQIPLLFNSLPEKIKSALRLSFFPPSVPVKRAAVESKRPSSRCDYHPSCFPFSFSPKSPFIEGVESEAANVRPPFSPLPFPLPLFPAPKALSRRSGGL